MFSELRQILEEDKPTRALRRLNQFKLLKVIHPKIVYGPSLENLLNSVDKVLSWHKLLFLGDACRQWMVYLLALERSLSQKVAIEFCDRLALNERYRKIFLDQKIKADQCRKWMEFQNGFSNSELYRKCRPFRTEHLLYMMASTTREEVRKAISHYFTRLRSVKTILKGNDLKKMGLEPGPIYRTILDSLLDARLNQDVKTRDDEVDFVQKNWSK